eukprot:5368673-Heterocapsa_arctica.AAC.1
MPPIFASTARSTAAWTSEAFTATFSRRRDSRVRNSKSSLTSASDNASLTSRASCLLVDNCASR